MRGDEQQPHQKSDPPQDKLSFVKREPPKACMRGNEQPSACVWNNTLASTPQRSCINREEPMHDRGRAALQRRVKPLAYSGFSPCARIDP